MRPREMFGASAPQGVFEQRGFAGAWTRDQATHTYSRGFESIAEPLREQVVLLENALSNFDDP